MIKYIGEDVDVIGQAIYLSDHRKDMTSEEFDDLLSKILEDARTDGFYMGIAAQSESNYID